MLSRFLIKYCSINLKGGVRKTNQDNFFVQNRYRKSNEPDIDLIYSGEFSSIDNEIIAVYDGMGGEACGEIASLIAASETPRYLNLSEENYLLGLCKYLNQKVCDFAKMNNVSSMGSTAAVMRFEKDKIFICNLGDSRIYRIREDGIKQISKDHILTDFCGKKPPITQFLGIPETDMLIEPYLAAGEYIDGDKYLLCSDGLTDMVHEEDIFSIVSKNSTNVEAATKELVSKALQNGGVDNITAILCEINKIDIFSNATRFINRCKKGE